MSEWMWFVGMVLVFILIALAIVAWAAVTVHNNTHDTTPLDQMMGDNHEEQQDRLV